MNEKDTLENVMNFIENELIKTVQTLRPTVTKNEARNVVGKIGARIMFGKRVLDENFEEYMREKK